MFTEWTDPSHESLETAIDVDQLLTLVSVYWFGRGGAGAANFLYETMHAPAAWGNSHDRPQGFVAFREEPLILRILDAARRIALLKRTRGRRHFPAMEQPGLLVGDLRQFFGQLKD